VRRALDGAERAGTWLSVGPIRPGRRPLWSERGGFTVGNAAGEAHPILGEGISMAMQGAFLLCARLEAQRDALLSGARQERTARHYERDWRRAFGARIRWAALFAALAMRPAARALLPALKAWPALLTAGAIAGGKVRPRRSRHHATGELRRARRAGHAKVASAPAAQR
jgi:flavin-dependent dehydrogenase